jgi:alkylmercury lyase
VYRDDAGAVVGFWGLAATEFPPHHYRLDGRDLWTWCAWDPFILTRWLGGRADVASTDARTGEPVTFPDRERART